MVVTTDGSWDLCLVLVESFSFDIEYGQLCLLPFVWVTTRNLKSVVECDG